MRIALLPLLLLATAAAAQPAPPAPAAPPPATVPAANLVKVALETSAGRIVLALDRSRAPITTANFLRYVDSKRLDGSSIYRAFKIGELGGVVQGGIRDAAKLYPPIAHEPTSKTGITHGDGTISMARAEPGSARADYFITVGQVPAFDAGAGQGDNLGYAAFGRVIEGLDVVRQLLAAPTSPTAGGAAMKGQMLDPPVKVTSARRVK